MGDPTGTRRGTNLPRMGDFNQSVVFDAIRRSTEGCSRVELVAATGLSAQTISNVVRRLLDGDLVVEAGKASSGPGKPRTLLRLNPGGAYAAGVHIDPAVMTFVVLDLEGAVVAHSRRRTPIANDPRLVMSNIQDGLDRLIADSGVRRDKVVGLGVAAPGPIDAERGTIVDPPHLLGWHRVPIRDALAESTGLPVLVDKDVTAAAVAEMWTGGANGMGSFVFFYLGTGIGAGLVLDDEVVRGASGNAGEVGHIVVDPGGAVCSCGLHGCIAATCTPQALVTEAERLGVIADTRLRSGAHDVDVRFTALCDLAAAGDAGARQILERSSARTAKAVAVLADLLDVDRVVFGGPFWQRFRPYHLERIPALLDELSVTRSIRRVQVVGTSAGEDVAAVGAACLVLERTLGPSAARLMLDA